MNIKNIFNHRVTRSAIALGLLQISNYAIPLLILPFLTRKLGIEAFGLVAISLAATQLTYTFIDYGFSLSATYKISTNRDNKKYINEKIGSIFAAKAVLIGIASIVTLLIPWAIQEYSPLFYFFLFALIAASAQSLQPIWLFQGTERMKSITIYSIITKVIYAVLVLLLIEKPEHALLVSASWAAAQIFGFLISVILMYRDGYKISTPTFPAIIAEFKEGGEYFWSRVAVSIYTSASTLVVGSIGANQAAQFSVCNQIYKAGQSITSPINSAMFPYMAKEKDWRAFYRVLAISTTTLCSGCIIIGLISEQLLGAIFGQEYRVASPILLIFLATSTINYLAITFGYPAFSALGRIDIANKSVLLGAAFHILLLAALFQIGKISSISVASSIFSTELLVATIRIRAFIRIKNSLKIDN